MPKISDKVYTMPTGGEGPARNLGIAASSGEFYAVMDSDDVWEPWHLARMVERLDADPDVVVLCGSFIVIGPDSQPWRRQVWLDGVEPEVMGVWNWWACRMVHPGIVMRRSTLDVVNGYRPTARATDWDLFQRLLMAGARQARIFEPTLRHREHPTRMSAESAAGERAAVIAELYTRALRHAGAYVPPDTVKVAADSRRELYQGSVKGWLDCHKRFWQTVARLPGCSELAGQALIRRYRLIYGRSWPLYASKYIPIWHRQRRQFRVSERAATPHVARIKAEERYGEM